MLVQRIRDSETMLYTSAISLCLVCFLHSFEPSQCRSTGRVSEFNSRADKEGLCLRWCFLQMSSRQTCIEKCLGRKKELQDKLEVRDKSPSASGIQLLTPLSRRRKRSVNGDDPSSLKCPTKAIDTNVHPAIDSVERQQYKDSNMSYVNISWNPINETLTNFTGYAFIFWHEAMNSSWQWRYIERRKNKTYLVYNESENGWNFDLYFTFDVITLPCRSNTFTMKDPGDFETPSPTGHTPTSLCPNESNDVNHYANIVTVEKRQYENSNTWYVNISWNPINETLTNISGYAFIFWYEGMDSFGHIERQKNETYVVYNASENGWDGNAYFTFGVITLPCRSNSFHQLNDLNDYLDPEDPSTKVPLTGTTATQTTASTTSIGVLAGTVTLGSLLLIVMIAFVLRRNYYKRSIEMAARIRPAGFHYDAFIIFNQKDQKWVQSKLLRILEGSHGFKCCVHYRDFEVGENFLQNISNSFEASHKVIAVISKNFFTSNWCNHELEQALYKQVNENNNSVIAIRIDDVTNDQLPAALKERSYIDYSNKVEINTWVSKLVQALESNSDEESLNSKNMGIPPSVKTENNALPNVWYS